MSYAFELGGVAIAFLLIGVLGIVIFDRIWFPIGLGAARRARRAAARPS
jgi:hypothetical protein